ncbi:MAG: hypothetical protein EOR60_09645 [Mesorhizobium sp.]|nr:MAG: hypothetical protein EOR60_09645 [Mesorhizobium sp.]
MELRGLRVLILAQCLFVAGMGTAEAQSTTYQILGAGTDSCGRWVSSANDGALHVAYMSWVLGYLSAFNMAKSAHSGQDSLFNQTDVQSLDLWVSNYCNAHPLKNLSDAALELAIEVTK